MHGSTECPSARCLHSPKNSLESDYATDSFAQYAKECDNGDYGYFTFHQDEDSEFQQERLRLEHQANIHYYREYTSSTSSNSSKLSSRLNSVEPPQFIYLTGPNQKSCGEDHDRDPSPLVRNGRRRYMYTVMMTLVVGSTLFVAATDAAISALAVDSPPEKLLEHQFQDLRI